MNLRLNIDDIDCDEGDDQIFYQGESFTGILYELAIDGNLSYEEEHTNGFPSGYQRMWWEPGKLREEIIYYHPDRPDSKYTEWYLNGVMKELKEDYNRTLLRHQKWNERGILIERWETLNEPDWDIFSPPANAIVNEKKHGTHTTWYDNGTIKETNVYVRGQLVYHQQWDINVCLTSGLNLRVNINDIECDGDRVVYQGESFTGILYELAIDGNLSYEEEHTNGFPSGYQRMWWEPGKLREEIIYYHPDRPDSKHTEWYLNGVMKELKESYNRTILRHQKWNERGILIERWETRNEPDWDIFSPPANAIVNEKQHGTNTTWYDNGTIKETNTYVRGQLVCHQQWDINGCLTFDRHI
jgi:antitoxin component YwqK of YwqJK toxin-antitoxin module